MFGRIRKVFANAVIAIACAIPLAAPAGANAHEAPPVNPAERSFTKKELHDWLVRGSGWVHNQRPQGLFYGTAWIVDLEKRLMVTNAHVVEDSDAVNLVFPMWKDGKLVREEEAYKNSPRVKGVVIDRDDNRDLALIQVESIPEGMHAFKIAAMEPDEGDEIRTIGAFTNGGDGLIWGSVSGTVRTVGPQPGRFGPQKVRQVLSNAGTNGGNSGAPVVNMKGELVAVHAAYKNNSIEVAVHIAAQELNVFLKEAVPLVRPSSSRQYMTRGKRRLACNRAGAAAADFTAALASEPKNAEALFLRGKASLQKRDTRSAIDDFTAALAIDPQNYQFLLERGVAYRDLGQFANSTADFTAAIKAQPDLPDGYNERGLTHTAAKKFALAEEDLSLAIEKSNNDPVPYANRAMARLDMKKLEAAIEDWKSAVKLAPRNPLFQAALGQTQLQLGKVSDAIESFMKSVELSGGHPIYVIKLGGAVNRKGDYKTSVKIFTEAIKALRDNGPSDLLAAAHAGRGIASRELKQYRDSIEDLSKAIDITNGKVAMLFIERALAYKAAGSKKEASDDFAAAIKLDPKLGNAVKAMNPLPGAWRGVFQVNGVTIVQVVLFKDDGTYEAAKTTITAFGKQTVTDTGTYSLSDGVLTLQGKNFGTIARKVSVSEKGIEVAVEEIGQTVTFTKVK